MFLSTHNSRRARIPQAWLRTWGRGLALREASRNCAPPMAQEAAGTRQPWQAPPMPASGGLKTHAIGQHTATQQRPSAAAFRVEARLQGLSGTPRARQERRALAAEDWSGGLTPLVSASIPK